MDGRDQRNKKPLGEQMREETTRETLRNPIRHCFSLESLNRRGLRLTTIVKRFQVRSRAREEILRSCLNIEYSTIGTSQIPAKST